MVIKSLAGWGDGWFICGCGLLLSESLWLGDVSSASSWYCTEMSRPRWDGTGCLCAGVMSGGVGESVLCRHNRMRPPLPPPGSLGTLLF
ncbi:hypothetical protein F4780DRAFT_741178 [Xylariomycetidae sp. FL0641]|nr:hypothetical protein F4780DRAFT_741178 [Xylariomycetidae sp. FL0641]